MSAVTDAKCRDRPCNYSTIHTFAMEDSTIVGIASKLVNAHHGTIVADSKVEIHNAEFSFENWSSITIDCNGNEDRFSSEKSEL